MQAIDPITKILNFFSMYLSMPVLIILVVLVIFEKTKKGGQNVRKNK